ncbi:TPA: hypothetical protein NKP47_005312 [Vibrio parahaemolyticus]|nr:hypothetical protein [Vibrio parahaemolyticus]HCH1013529.1 hypothetical protein [Vibrio parahaemolyticus]
MRKKNILFCSLLLMISNSSSANTLPPDFFGLQLTLGAISYPVNQCLAFSEKSLCVEANKNCPQLLHALDSYGGINAFIIDAQQRGNASDLSLAYEAEGYIQKCVEVKNKTETHAFKKEPNFRELSPIAKLLDSSLDKCMQAVKKESHDALDLCDNFVNLYSDKKATLDEYGDIDWIINYPVSLADQEKNLIQRSLQRTKIMYTNLNKVY